MRRITPLSNRGPRAVSLFLALFLGCTVALLNGSKGIEASHITLVVNTNIDGVGACGAISPPSVCTLRAAIQEANLHPGLDTIAFNIQGAGPWTIVTETSLPEITEAVIIDGYTQPGASPNSNPPELGTNAVLKIRITPFVNQTQNGLVIFGGGSTVRGLVLERFSDAIQLFDLGGNRIEGNFIGTADFAGTMPSLQTAGVFICDSSDNVIGGTTPQARNVISGNDDAGVLIHCGSSRNSVLGNLIGTDATGTRALSTHLGVQILSNDNTVGGTTPAARNVISGNTTGVAVGLTTANVVQGNFIGTDVSGTAGLGNSVGGIGVHGTNNTIGGASPGAGNVISGNMYGVYFPGSFGEVAALNAVQGNYIGTDVSGAHAIGNTRSGVLVEAGRDNTIGGANTGAPNVVAFNGESGIVECSGATRISSNSIFSNRFLGIDYDDTNTFCSGNGVTSNGSGAQNYPVVSSAIGGTSGVTVRGVLNSNPTSAFTVEFFADAACDPEGYGEGATFIGSASVTTDSSGNAAFAASFLRPTSPGEVITTTATGSRTTSEFSACRQVEPAAAGDIDGDGVEDGIDNCPSIPNVNQANEDSDVVGTACDLCPGTAPGAGVDANGCSQAQVDADGDGICSPGAPSGGPPPPCTASDNCPTTPNASQTDSDGDLTGDACDNCPSDANPGQENTDAALAAAGASVTSDGLGDACDADDDNDSAGALANRPSGPCPGTGLPLFDDCVEAYLGTNPLDNCVAGPGTGGDAWPPDIAGPSGGAERRCGHEGHRRTHRKLRQGGSCCSKTRRSNYQRLH